MEVHRAYGSDAALRVHKLGGLLGIMRHMQAIHHCDESSSGFGIVLLDPPFPPRVLARGSFVASRINFGARLCL